MTSTATQKRRGQHLAMALFVRAEAWLLALNSQRLDRIIALDDTDCSHQETKTGQNPAELGILEFGESLYAAWDLCVLLGLQSEKNSWVLLHCQSPDGTQVPLALRTGPCASAGPLYSRQLSRLPEGLLRKRSGAFSAAFQALPEQSGNSDQVAAGLRMNLRRLWTGEELARSLTRIQEFQASR